MVQVNNEWFYEDLTPENTKELLDKMVAGTEEPGPQIEERFNSEGPQGRTCLHTMPDSVFDRDFEQIKADWEAKKAESAKQ